MIVGLPAVSMQDRVFFFKQKTAYEIASCLVGSEMCIRDSIKTKWYQNVEKSSHSCEGKQ